jgi:hypothetical protein
MPASKQQVHKYPHNFSTSKQNIKDLNENCKYLAIAVYTHIDPATAFPRKKHNPILTPTSGPSARPMR